jgi:alkylation response protein AidB-like acyl-CoA dehydrogenase
MDWELQPVTEPGRRFVAAAEAHAADFAKRAAEHDADGTFPHENFDELKASGFLTAPVPEEFGGWGLTSVNDYAAGVNRLARGDGSTAIASAMHLSFCLMGARTWRLQEALGDDQAAVSGGFLSLLGAGAVAMANVTEPGTDIRHPLTEFTKVEGGYRLNGHKIFGTLSEVADLFFVPGRITNDDGSVSRVGAIVTRGTPGQQIKSNWDALGMRGSGSHDIVYEDCFIEEALMLPGGAPLGEDDMFSLSIATAAQLPLVAAMFGIAERAYELVVHMARTRKKAPSNRPLAERAAIQQQVAEMEVDMVTARALLAWGGRFLDEVFVDMPVTEVDTELLHDVNRELQCVKLTVNRKAIEIVDRALTISGGAGYMSGNELSRLYRDVRAGPFMQPLSPVDVYEYVGKVALGLDPAVES